MHELPDEYLADVLALAKRVAMTQELDNYNILQVGRARTPGPVADRASHQNNGRIAYQTVDHVHFHVINKPDEESGLIVKWPPQKSAEELEVYRAKLFEEREAAGKTASRS